MLNGLFALIMSLYQRKFYQLDLNLFIMICKNNSKKKTDCTKYTIYTMKLTKSVTRGHITFFLKSH